MSLNNITNFLVINPWLATAGMPNKEQLQIIGGAGYHSVINLALNTSPGAIPNEKEILNSSGVMYYHIPVIWESPQKTDFEKFASIMQTLRKEKTFVHCVLNMRVSIFVYLYRVLFLKEAPDLAYQDVLKIWEPDHIWGKLMEDVLSSN